MDQLNLNLKSWKLFFSLYKLAELGASSRTIKVSTEYLAEKIGSSQQTASRHLISLEKIGWIKRTITPDGCLIKGVEAFRSGPVQDFGDHRTIMSLAMATLAMEGDLTIPKTDSIETSFPTFFHELDRLRGIRKKA